MIRVDWDVGFFEGRQYGRGKHGYQWRDCFRENDDPERPKVPPDQYKKMKKNDDRENDGNRKVL